MGIVWEASVSRPRRTGASSRTHAASTAGTKVCKSITWCTGRQDSSQAPYCMVLDPTGSTKALLSMDRCQIVVGGGDTDEGHLIQSWCWCHVFTLMLHNLFLLLLTLIKVIHIVGVTMVHWFSSFLVFSKLLRILRVFLYKSYILIPY